MSTIKDLSYFLPGNKNGVLLIHGLTGTPHEMRMLANGLHKAGFTVYAIQLAGHCGTEADLCKTSWQDWYQSVQDGADYLAQHVDNVFVAGLSMGAVLALKLASDRPVQIKGVGVLAPTFRYDGWSIPLWAKKAFHFLVFFKKIGIFQKCSFIERPPYGIKDKQIRAVISQKMLSGDVASAGIPANPYPALAEMQLLAKNVKAQLPKIVSPCLIIHSGDDDVADIETNAKLVEKNVSGSKKLVILNDSYHLITVDKERREVIKECITYFNNIVEGIKV